MFVSKMSKNADLFEHIRRDWTGISTKDSLFAEHSGRLDLDYLPFGDLVILDANLTKTGSEIPNKNKCPPNYVPLSR